MKLSINDRRGKKRKCAQTREVPEILKRRLKGVVGKRGRIGVDVSNIKINSQSFKVNVIGDPGLVHFFHNGPRGIAGDAGPASRAGMDAIIAHPVGVAIGKCITNIIESGRLRGTEKDLLVRGE